MRKNQGELLPGSGGALAPCARMKIHPRETKHQKIPSYEIELREGDEGAQGIRRELLRANPPGANRDLVAGRGKKQGGAQSRDTAADTGMCSRAHRQAAEAGRWRVRTTSRWTAFCAGRGGWGRVQDRGATIMNATGGGR